MKAQIHIIKIVIVFKIKSSCSISFALKKLQSIKTAFKLTPSKQNLYPYTVYVLGPKNKQEKLDFYDIVCHQKGGPQNTNILSASYCLIFSLRLVTNPDPMILKRIKLGHPYEMCDPNQYHLGGIDAALEIGMFAKIITTLCMAHGLDVAYTRCFPPWEHNKDKWKKLDFIRDPVIFSMQFGNRYENEKAAFKPNEEKEKKPNTDEVIKWL